MDKEKVFRKKSHSLSCTCPLAAVEPTKSTAKLFKKAHTIQVYSPEDDLKSEDQKAKEFEEQIYIAKIEGKTVSVVAGNLFIDYKCYGKLPDGVKF